MHLQWQRLDGRDGHTAGRQLLAQMVDPMPQINIDHRGKPHFATGDLHFSITHTEKHVFCAISHQNIGIDAEECARKVSPNLAKKVLSPSEFALWQAAPNQDEALLRLWVLKESYAKLTGRGLGEYLYHTNFDPSDPRIQVIDGCFVAVMEEE